jgi:hypothetical protein
MLFPPLSSFQYNRPQQIPNNAMVVHGFPLTCFPALPSDLQHHQQDHGPKECADAGNTGANQQTQLPEQLDLVW